MAFNSSFAGSSGVENFINNSIDFGTLYNAAATQDALERLNAVKREGSTFNSVLGADARSEIEKLRMEGQQNLHDAQMFSENLGSAAGLLSSGIGAAGKAGWFNKNPVTKAHEGLGGFGPVASGQAYGDFLDATSGTSGIGPFMSSDVYGSFLSRK